ncbi:hypothetical protein I316_04373 [Kwoniella heveanensis BCC8398]|uniref:Phosphoglycerate mutase n=1 Tax=Kwoniella heveanensis BCC8398 TaxID=1296120 RepID=A0A1B9GSR1_9TREE|nr:hypothetical protein I316_04373 [Kwoniella heveanensis BCC8398]
MRLFFVRHGQTEDNVRGIIQGHKDTPLNDYGREESRRVAERLKNAKIVEAWSSPLSRAQETAEIILQHHPGIELQLHDGIKERCLGSMEGRRRARGEHAPDDAEHMDHLYRRAMEWFEAFLESHEPPTPLPSHPSILTDTPNHASHPSRCTDVRSYSQHHNNIQRSKDATVNFNDESDEKIVLIVSHGAWLGAFFHLLLSKYFNCRVSSSVDKRLPCYNTSLMVVRCDFHENKRQWKGKIERWADVEHLKGMMGKEVKEVTDDVK